MTHAGDRHDSPPSAGRSDRGDAIETVPDSGVWLSIGAGQAVVTLARAAQRNTLDSRALPV